MRLICAALVVLLAACQGGSEPWHGHDLRGVMPDLAYTLTDETGAAVSAGAYAGKVRVVFFGYTNCPDICPTTLARLKRAIGRLPAGERDQVRVLFVSVDPDRDTPEQLARYTGAFGTNFIGMTGSQRQLTELTKRYRVSYGYGAPDDNGFYPVSHSSGTFVFGPDGAARLLWSQDETPEEIAADLERLLAATA